MDLKCNVCGELVEMSVRTFKNPRTGVWECEHDLVTHGPSKMEQQRKENVAKTIEAQRQASMARAETDAANPEVIVRGQSNGEAASRFAPGSLPIRKQTIDKIVEKIQNSEVSKELVEGSLKQ